MSNENSEDKIKNWWNDGESKIKKITYLFFNWWNDGKNKLIKSIYVSLVLHILFAVFLFSYKWLF